MQTNQYQAYVENEVLTAEPIKLVQLLYRGGLEAVANARARLAKGDIKGRSAAVTNAIEILAELSITLNHEKGGQLSGRLASLYDYMQRRLIAANHSQTDPPLAEVAQLLNTLAEAWVSVRTSVVNAPVLDTPIPVLDTPMNTRPVRGRAAERYAAPADYEPVSCTG